MTRAAALTILSEQLGYTPAEDALLSEIFRDDLDLHLFELTISNELDVSIPDSAMLRWVSVKDALDCIETMAGRVRGEFA